MFCNIYNIVNKYLNSKSFNNLFSAVVGYECCFSSSDGCKGQMKVACGMAGSQFADSFRCSAWTAGAQTGFFNDLFLFFLACQFDGQEDKVHIFFYGYKPELLNAEKTFNNTWAVISLPLISNLRVFKVVLALYFAVIEEPSSLSCVPRPSSSRCAQRKKLFQNKQI